MNKSIVTIVIVVIAVVAGGIWISQRSNEPSASPSPSATVLVSPSASVSPSSSANPSVSVSVSPKTSPVSESTADVVITYTDEGYNPAQVTIKAGTKIVFKNNSTKDMWPASAMHPTHKVYPGSDIVKCKTADVLKIFDACQGIKSGQSYSFVFTQIGAWGFHDHILPTKFGKITVE